MGRMCRRCFTPHVRESFVNFFFCFVATMWQLEWKGMVGISCILGMGNVE